MHFFTSSKMSEKSHFWKDFSSQISKMILKSVRHQITEKIAFEVPRSAVPAALSRWKKLRFR